MNESNTTIELTNSLTKNLIISETKCIENVIQNYSKDSFNRFGDDLCELLLSYLTISDKFSYECVCKQWQRLVFNKHKTLIISNDINSCFVGRNVDTISQLLSKSREYKRLFTIDKQLFELLLKKFCFIEEIIIDNYCIIDGQILTTIADNCQNLRQFVCTSIKCMNISPEELSNFGHKLRNTLNSIQFDGLKDKQLSTILRQTKNIRLVNVERNQFVIRNDFVFIDFIRREIGSNLRSKHVLCPKLKTIYICCYSVEDLKLFADLYSKQIKKIEIKFMSYYLLGSALNSCLKQLARFRSLEALTLLIYNYQKGFIGPIDEGLKLIGQNCPKLKHFVLEMTKNLISGPFFEVFAQFSSLITCKISTTYESLDDYGSIARLVMCSQLKHLTLYLKYLSDKHFKGLNQVLPKLKSFKINTSNGFISDETLRELSKLSQLTTIEISGTSPSLVNITDAGVSTTIATCPTITTLCLFCRTRVGQKTVEQFITTAKKFPKNVYKYFYEFSNEFDVENETEIPVFSTNNIPQNLSVYQI